MGYGPLVHFKGPSLFWARIIPAVCHHSASLVMPKGDPGDRFFDPTLTLMINSNLIILYRSEYDNRQAWSSDCRGGRGG